MSSIEARLGRLRTAGSSPVVPPVDVAKSETIDRLRQMIERAMARHSRPAVRPRPELEALPGRLTTTPHGDVQLVRRIYEREHAHGRVVVTRARDVPVDAVAALALDPSLVGLDVGRALYLDTETTGLAGGTGTLPFLIGLAWFDGPSLVVEQMLLRQPGEEGPMLGLLAERLQRASCLVTYNGKSFDVPLLRTRFVLARVPIPALPPHVDLLHCARRVLRHRMAELGVGVRLVEVERVALGLTREDDIGGEQIPMIYREWLTLGRAERLARVLDHNSSDLVALPATLVALADRWGVREHDVALEHLALTELAWRAKDWPRALRLAALLDRGAPSELERAKGRWWTARIERRMRREAKRAADAPAR